MVTSIEKQLHCDMNDLCEREVTMMDQNGFIYCEMHGMSRRSWKPCRKLRTHELNRLKRGGRITKY